MNASAIPPIYRLTCRELVELVSELVDDELDRDQRDRVEWHLFECRGCSVYVEQIRLTVKLLGSLAP